MYNGCLELLTPTNGLKGGKAIKVHPRQSTRPFHTCNSLGLLGGTGGYVGERPSCFKLQGWAVEAKHSLTTGTNLWHHHTASITAQKHVTIKGGDSHSVRLRPQHRTCQAGRQQGAYHHQMTRMCPTSSWSVPNHQSNAHRHTQTIIFLHPRYSPYFVLIKKSGNS